MELKESGPSLSNTYQVTSDLKTLMLLYIHFSDNLINSVNRYFDGIILGLRLFTDLEPLIAHIENSTDPAVVA